MGGGVLIWLTRVLGIEHGPLCLCSSLPSPHSSLYPGDLVYSTCITELLKLQEGSDPMAHLPFASTAYATQSSACADHMEGSTANLTSSEAHWDKDLCALPPSPNHRKCNVPSSFCFRKATRRFDFCFVFFHF